MHYQQQSPRIGFGDKSVFLKLLNRFLPGFGSLYTGIITETVFIHFAQHTTL